MRSAGPRSRSASAGFAGVARRAEWRSLSGRPAAKARAHAGQCGAEIIGRAGTVPNRFLEFHRPFDGLDRDVALPQVLTELQDPVQVVEIVTVRSELKVIIENNAKAMVTGMFSSTPMAIMRALSSLLMVNGGRAESV